MVTSGVDPGPAGRAGPSGLNRTGERFRRSLIGHYLHADVRQVAAFYHPALAMDGTLLTLGVSPGGGPCGEWSDHDGVPAIEMTGRHPVSEAYE